MNVFSPKAGFLPARIGFLALASVATVASGVVVGPARAELLARVPGAREMAVCGDILFVGTKGSSVYAVPFSGGLARRVASGILRSERSRMLPRSFVRRFKKQRHRVQHRAWGRPER